MLFPLCQEDPRICPLSESAFVVEKSGSRSQVSVLGGGAKSGELR